MLVWYSSFSRIASVTELLEDVIKLARQVARLANDAIRFIFTDKI